jgi:hypothetical protein
VPSASSGFRVKLLLDDAILASLDGDSFYLHQILIVQPDNEALVFNFNNNLFGYDGYVQVFVTDVIELMKGAWINISIVQIFCMKEYILL